MPRVADQLIETLKSEIYKGVLKPGDQLEEASLADRFGVSRTPIREAVRSLVELGLLETRPRKGAFVRVASAKELIDLFEVAAELEALACRLAAERLTDDTSLEIQIVCVNVKKLRRFRIFLAMLAVICNFMPLYALHLPIYGLQQNCLKSKCASIHTAQCHIKYTTDWPNLFKSIGK